MNLFNLCLLATVLWLHTMTTLAVYSAGYLLQRCHFADGKEGRERGREVSATPGYLVHLQVDIVVDKPCPGVMHRDGEVSARKPYNGHYSLKWKDSSAGPTVSQSGVSLVSADGV